MSQRIVVIGDLHLDARIAGREYFEDIKAKLLGIPIREGDIVVQLGDVCDPDNGPRTWRALQMMSDWLGSHEGSTRVVVAGNHDVVDDSRVETCLGALGNVGGTIVVTEPCMEYLGGSSYGLFLPWQSRAHGEFDVEVSFQLLCEANKLGPDSKILVFCHKDIPGAVPGSEGDLPRLGSQMLPQEIIDDERVEMVFAGHIHTPGTIGKVEIVGSLECLGMGERDSNEHRGWVEVNL